jgi:hypothetical protein
MDGMSQAKKFEDRPDRRGGDCRGGPASNPQVLVELAWILPAPEALS